MTTQDIARRYDRWSSLYDLADMAGPLGWSEREWRRRAAKRLEEVAGWVLDAACGTGTMLEYLGGSRRRLIAIDASRKMVRKARSRCGSRGEGPWVILGDVNRLPLRDGVLGGIICTFSLTTVHGPEKVLMDFERVMGTGSKLVVLDSERPRGLLARLVYPALVPISRFFCHTHIDRDVDGLLSASNGLERTDEEHYLGGMVALYESKRMPHSGTLGAKNRI